MLIGTIPTFLLSLDLWSIGYVIVFFVVVTAFELAREGKTDRTKFISIAVFVNIITATVYVIENGSASHMLLFDTAPYTLANGTTVSLSSDPGGKAIVVNNRPNQARFETLRYGSSSGAGSGSSYIAGYSVGTVPHRPDHFGPFDGPPQSVSVRGREGSAVRYWLTW
jgi:hypothetical protein